MMEVTRLETIVRRAPLGLRFLDLARGVPVTDGIEVRAWPVAGTGPGHQAIRSPLSGIYGFRSLPGFRLFETGERPASDWCDPAGGSPPGDTEPNFVVAVEDRQQRFLPQALRLCLPRERLMEVPLFSAPARAPLPGLAVIRGELWDRVQARPAAWAMVTASTDDAATYVGLADARGIFTLFVPYASALPPLQGSPPHGSGDVDQLTWPLVIQVFYQPAQQISVPGLDWPETRSVLEQHRAEVYDTPASHGPAVTRSLHFGQDLVISTQGLDPPHQSRLLVDPA